MMCSLQPATHYISLRLGHYTTTYRQQVPRGKPITFFLQLVTHYISL